VSDDISEYPLLFELLILVHKVGIQTMITSQFFKCNLTNPKIFPTTIPIPIPITVTQSFLMAINELFELFVNITWLLILSGELHRIAMIFEKHTNKRSAIELLHFPAAQLPTMLLRVPYD